MKKKRKTRPLRKKVKIKKPLSTDKTTTVRSDDINTKKNSNIQEVDFKKTQPGEENNTDRFEQLYIEMKKRYEFLLAEYANYKKQTIKQQALFQKYEGKHFIINLLNQVMDNFDRAMNTELTEQTAENFKQGMTLIYENLNRLLKEFNIKEIPCEGKPFDPAVHSAISSIVTDNVAPEHVVNVLRKAYFFHDKLLRPAEVIVSRKDTENTENNNKESNNE